MIVANLNALREWQRVRENTEPEIPDVDRNPGSKDTDRASLHEPSHGIAPRRRRRRRRRRREEGSSQHGGFPVEVVVGHVVGREGDEIVLHQEEELEEREVDELPWRGLIAEYQGANVDLDG